MDKSGNGQGGAFKYISGWYDLASLIDHVTASYDGEKTKAQLVISHGCAPHKKPAWCSPGYWIHAEDAAWALTAQSKTDLFNETVYSYFYGATFNPDPTLYGVLTATNPSPYKGAGVTGTSGCAMNAFNAVGAFLTSKLEGYEFSCALMQADSDTSDSDDPCPIDIHGNFKTSNP